MEKLYQKVTEFLNQAGYSTKVGETFTRDILFGREHSAIIEVGASLGQICKEIRYYPKFSLVERNSREVVYEVGFHRIRPRGNDCFERYVFVFVSTRPEVRNLASLIHRNPNELVLDM
jgi:hypothetical protein